MRKKDVRSLNKLYHHYNTLDIIIFKNIKQSTRADKTKTQWKSNLTIYSRQYISLLHPHLKNSYDSVFNQMWQCKKSLGVSWYFVTLECSWIAALCHAELQSDMFSVRLSDQSASFQLWPRQEATAASGPLKKQTKKNCKRRLRGGSESSRH